MSTSYTKKISPMPWRKDQLNNIYDADGNLIFKAVAFEELGPGVMEENDGNAEFVVLASREMCEDEDPRAMGWVDDRGRP